MSSTSAFKGRKNFLWLAILDFMKCSPSSLTTHLKISSTFFVFVSTILPQVNELSKNSQSSFQMKINEFRDRCHWHCCSKATYSDSKSWCLDWTRRMAGRRTERRRTYHMERTLCHWLCLSKPQGVSRDLVSEFSKLQVFKFKFS